MHVSTVVNLIVFVVRLCKREGDRGGEQRGAVKRAAEEKSF